MEDNNNYNNIMMNNNNSDNNISINNSSNTTTEDISSSSFSDGANSTKQISTSTDTDTNTSINTGTSITTNRSTSTSTSTVVSQYSDDEEASQEIALRGVLRTKTRKRFRDDADLDSDSSSSSIHGDMNRLSSSSILGASASASAASAGVVNNNNNNNNNHTPMTNNDSKHFRKRHRGLETTKVGITTSDLKTRMRSLFGDDVLKKTCMSARLFGAFSLLNNASVTSNHTDTPLKRSRRNDKSPLMLLLQAYVDVERLSLDQVMTNKKVQFTGFDDSSTKPPRDSILGSHWDRHKTIQAMENVLDQVNRIIQIDHNDPSRNAIIQQLVTLRDFLAKVQTEGDEYGTSIREECSKACTQSYWATDRFIKAAKFYNHDIANIVECLEQKQTSLADCSKVELQVEKLLASSISRTIRFHLRRFFNPIYGTIIEAPDVKEACWKEQSNISDMIQMTLPEWYDPGSNSAVGDGAVSTVISIALETIYQRFGANRFLTEHFELPHIPKQFFNEGPAQRGLDQPAISIEDQETILQATYDTQNFLSAAKACRFISELLKWPGVEEEIARVGGWSIIEDYAKVLYRHRLHRLSPSDSAHFILLCDVSRLLDRIQTCWEAMEDSAEDATTALNELWNRFECDTRKRKLQERYPIINVLRDVLEDGLKYHMFPDLAEPSEVHYNDDDDDDVAADYYNEDEVEDDDDEDDDDDDDASVGSEK